MKSKFKSQSDFVQTSSDTFNDKIRPLINKNSLLGADTIAFIAKNELTATLSHPLSNNFSEKSIDIRSFSTINKNHNYKFAIIPIQYRIDYHFDYLRSELKLVIVDLENGSIVWKGMEASLWHGASVSLERIGGAFTKCVEGSAREISEREIQLFPI